MKYENDGMYFSSGRQHIAIDGIIGLNENQKIVVPTYRDENGDPTHFLELNFLKPTNCNFLTKEDFAEIADYMIDAWSKFKERL